MKGLAASAWLPLVMTACAAASTGGGRPLDVARDDRADDAKRIAAFDREEDAAMSWIAAADPRLAARERANGGAVASDAEVLKEIGMEAVLAEDATAAIHNGSLDLFAFRARARALHKAAAHVAASPNGLPETAQPEAGDASPPGRPKLERELLERLIDEEQARTAEEAQLGDAAGDLVRAIVATWTPPGGPEEWTVRDAWVGAHLLELRDALRQHRPRSGPPDLDVALYPLERLLAPLVFPRGSAAIAQLRVGLDEDMRTVPPIALPERVAREAKVHLGVSLDPATLPARFEQTAARLAELASAALDASGSARPTVEARARELLFVEGWCPAVGGSRVRSMAPPPERAAICGVIGALTQEPAPALVALHDDLLLAAAAVTTSPPPRTGLLSHPDDDVVDGLRRTARERPVLAIGVALAAELLYGTDGADARLRAWRGLGEAPLDVVARELSAAR
jgi:hypothetical protein